MNRTAFFEAAGQLCNWVSNLQGTTESSLRQIEDILCCRLSAPSPLLGGEGRVRGSSPGALSDAAVLFLCLGAIRDRIEEVMNAFDALCEAAGRAPPFELAFQVLDAPRLVQWEVRQRLEGKPHPLYSPSHPPLNRYEQ